MLRNIVIISFMATILFVQEEALTIIPNFQFTFLLIITFSVVFGFKRTFFIILIHVLLDNLFMGTFNLLAIAPMLFSYTMIDLIINAFKIKKAIPLTFPVNGIAFLLVLFYLSNFSPVIK